MCSERSDIAYSHRTLLCSSFSFLFSFLQNAILIRLKTVRGVMSKGSINEKMMVSLGTRWQFALTWSPRNLALTANGKLGWVVNSHLS